MDFLQTGFNTLNLVLHLGAISSLRMPKLDFLEDGVCHISHNWCCDLAGLLDVL